MSSHFYATWSVRGGCKGVSVPVLVWDGGCNLRGLKHQPRPDVAVVQAHQSTRSRRHVVMS